MIPGLSSRELGEPPPHHSYYPTPTLYRESTPVPDSCSKDIFVQDD